MAPKNKSVIQRAVSKRDKLHNTLVFNREFPAVESGLIDEKNDKRIKRQEIKSKKRLLPLEIAALPEVESNAVRRERELAQFEGKQKLPRRAVQQTYLRKVKKEGETAAQQYRQAALKKLDDEAAAKRAELERKYPTNGSTQVPAAAAAAYKKASQEEEEKMQALRKQLQEKKDKRLATTNARLEKENAKLQAKFDTVSRQLQAASQQHEDAFGEGDILSVRDLKMYFSGIKAVDGLSFNIKQGEIF